MFRESVRGKSPPADNGLGCNGLSGNSSSDGRVQACRSPHRRARGQSTFLIVGATLVLALATGCDRLSRHKVLTFFFTGVPSIEEQDRMKEAAREEAKTPKNVVAGGSAAQRKRPRFITPSREFSHGPFAASACHLCHETAARGGPPGAVSKPETPGLQSTGSIVPGSYVVPLQELCASCHESKSPVRAYEAGLWIHGPVGNGYCIMCHSPHASREPFMLLKEIDALCSDCHGEGEIFSRAVHKERQDCTTCHNPHVGKDSRLLKADYKESW